MHLVEFYKFHIQKYHLFFLRFIIKRKSNKVFIKLNIVPDSDLKSDEEVVAGFTLQFTYVSNQSASRMADESLTEASIREHALSVRTYVDAGKVQC